VIFQFDFRLEDATPAQADALLETILLWADRRNCWIAGGYHRADGGVPSEEVKREENENIAADEIHPSDRCGSARTDPDLAGPTR